jgi:hypothetical protein
VAGTTARRNDESRVVRIMMRFPDERGPRRAVESRRRTDDVRLRDRQPTGGVKIGFEVGGVVGSRT